MKTKFKIIRNFIDKDLAFDLHNWVISQKKLTLWNKPSYYIGGYRFFDPDNKIWKKDEYGRILNPIENIRKDFLDLRTKISKVLNLDKEFISKNSTSLLSMLKKGSFVDLHYDSTLDDCDHIRSNIILSNSEGGALFVIGEKEYDLFAGDLVSFPANLLKHGTTIHNSDVPRTLLSYPFLIRH